MNLEKYIKAFENLRVDSSHAKQLGSKAPHKPILLLSVIDSIENDEISTNKVFITPELVSIFRANWACLVQENYRPEITLPFYHLKNEKDRYWRLIPKSGYERLTDLKIRSFSLLVEAIEYAEIDQELFSLMSDESTRHVLRSILLDTYFLSTKHLYVNKTHDYKNYLNSIENKIIRESPVIYRQESVQLDEEESFIRKSVFKKVIPRIYNYTCCISELRIDAIFDIRLIDACHIIPFSQSHDDTVSNGISLCPNLHRAFDRGLLSFSDDYRVIISKSFAESHSCYGLKQFSGKKILLPQDELFYPNVENLRWHRDNVLK